MAVDAMRFCAAETWKHLAHAKSPCQHESELCTELLTLRPERCFINLAAASIKVQILCAVLSGSLGFGRNLRAEGFSFVLWLQKWMQ